MFIFVRRKVTGASSSSRLRLMVMVCGGMDMFLVDSHEQLI